MRSASALARRTRVQLSTITEAILAGIPSWGYTDKGQIPSKHLVGGSNPSRGTILDSEFDYALCCCVRGRAAFDASVATACERMIDQLGAILPAVDGLELDQLAL